MNNIQGCHPHNKTLWNMQRMSWHIAPRYLPEDRLSNCVFHKALCGKFHTTNSGKVHLPGCVNERTLLPRKLWVMISKRLLIIDEENDNFMHHILYNDEATFCTCGYVKNTIVGQGLTSSLICCKSGNVTYPKLTCGWDLRMNHMSSNVYESFLFSDWTIKGNMYLDMLNQFLEP